MLGTVIKNSIKYAITKNIITYNDLAYDESFIGCSLVGGRCSVICPLFKIDESCKYSTFQKRYITIGELVYLTTLASEKELEDKDFLLRIITGKSMLGESLNDNEIKRFINDDENINLDREETENKVIQIIEKHFKFTKITDKNKEYMIPSLVKNIEKIKKEGLYPELLSINEHISMITSNYYEKENLSKNDIDIILKYLVFFYNPLEAEFPLNIEFNREKINALRMETKHLPPKHPKKWTKARLDMIEQSMDNYNKYLYLNDNFYSWYEYGYKEEWNQEEINRYLISMKYILDNIIQRYAYLYTPNFIIFYQETNIDKLQKIIKIMEEITKDSIGSEISYLFFKNQLENCYHLNIERKKINTVFNIRKVSEIKDKHKQHDLKTKSIQTVNDIKLETDPNVKQLYKINNDEALKKWKEDLSKSASDASRLNTNDPDTILKKLIENNNLYKIMLIKPIAYENNTEKERS